ncbi:hypothetical protein I6B53_08220 [Schaalia sp. 19OD2882]|uniref:hypothetical protein n=1 Tax=Schaalia sp. 19OD2882 TaxID=2794089 RepID=UPI001C1E90E8|nr:hypothetical protein [Schaalia sp. 19OD2882]QWW19099.1 hypothetical protein I6B53_08220 [Schaalia sp. 19OD2882]
MSSTPFEELSDNVEEQAALLSGEQSGRLFVAAARALYPAYVRSCSEVGIEGDQDLMNEILTWAQQPAGQRDEAVGRSLFSRAEEMPEEEVGESEFGTIGIDCWTCAYVGLGSLVDGEYLGDGAWSLLEPTMESVSERLLGGMPGSGGDDGEELALEDPQFVEVRDGVDRAFALLSCGGLSIVELVEVLAPLLPPEARWPVDL